MDWLIFIATTLVVAAVVGVVAREIARRLAAAQGELGMGLVLLAIVVSLAVLQGAAKLAVLIEWLFTRQGVDPATALDGQFYVMAFAASFVPIAAYVLTFLLVFRKVRGNG